MEIVIYKSNTEDLDAHFDHDRSLESLLSPEIIALIAEIHEYKGRHSERKGRGAGCARRGFAGEVGHVVEPHRRRFDARIPHPRPVRRGRRTPQRGRANNLRLSGMLHPRACELRHDAAYAGFHPRPAREALCAPSLRRRRVEDRVKAGTVPAFTSLRWKMQNLP